MYEHTVIVKVICECGYSWLTSMNEHVTEEQAIKYFVGQTFNIGTYPKEQMTKVIEIEYNKELIT